MRTPGSSSIYTTDPSPSPSTVEHRINSIQNTVYLRVPVLALYCSSYTQGNCLRSSDVTYPMWSFVQVTLLFFQEKKKPESLGRRHTVTDLRTRDFYGTFPYNALLHKNRYTRDRFSSFHCLNFISLHLTQNVVVLFINHGQNTRRSHENREFQLSIFGSLHHVPLYKSDIFIITSLFIF